MNGYAVFLLSMSGLILWVLTLGLIGRRCIERPSGWLRHLLGRPQVESRDGPWRYFRWPMWTLAIQWPIIVFSVKFQPVPLQIRLAILACLLLLALAYTMNLVYELRHTDDRPGGGELEHVIDTKRYRSRR